MPVGEWAPASAQSYSIRYVKFHHLQLPLASGNKMEITELLSHLTQLANTSKCCALEYTEYIIVYGVEIASNTNPITSSLSGITSQYNCLVNRILCLDSRTCRSERGVTLTPVSIQSARPPHENGYTACTSTKSVLRITP